MLCSTPRQFLFHWFVVGIWALVCSPQVNLAYKSHFFGYIRQIQLAPF